MLLLVMVMMEGGDDWMVGMVVAEGGVLASIFGRTSIKSVKILEEKGLPLHQHK